MQLTHKPVRLLVLGGLIAAGIAGCGGDDKDPSKVGVQVTESGKQAQISLPAKIEGGAVEFTFDNASGKSPHSVQLIKVEDGHSAEEALKIVNSDNQEIPEWIRGEGGVGATKPGESGTATVDLDEGHYIAVDDEAEGPNPPFTEFDVEGDNGADLPDTDATVTAATTGEDDPEYEWKTDGLKAGENTFTFVSEGDKALHVIAAAPIKGNATIDDVAKDLDSNGEPKSVDFENLVGTAVIDGGKDEVTSFKLNAGRYAFICFLPDRDEPNKPHYKEGLLKEVTIGG